MDPSILMRKWISTQLPTSRISVAILPRYDDKNAAGFQASDGPWIVVSAAGGRFVNTIFFGSIQITVYADVDEVVSAVTLAGQIRDLINEKTNINLTPDGYVMSCFENTGEIPSAETEAGYAIDYATYEVILRSN
jgi:hypothetical protein